MKQTGLLVSICSALLVSALSSTSYAQNTQRSVGVNGDPVADSNSYSEPAKNGKPALDWVVDRQCVKTDKDSGIVNDANLWATETVGDAKYPLELFQRVITVSLETMKIVNGLPVLDI